MEIQILGYRLRQNRRKVAASQIAEGSNRGTAFYAFGVTFHRETLPPDDRHGHGMHGLQRPPSTSRNWRAPHAPGFRLAR
jgi:hypothetical protein